MLCPVCRKSQMREARVAKMYDKVLVESVRVLRCGNCGAESLGEGEYERVRILVHKIQQKTPQRILASVKYLVV